MTNPYEDELIGELRDELEGVGCRADWQEFWGVIRAIDDNLPILADIYSDREELVDKLKEFAQGTRADLPSLEAFIWHEVEKALGK